MTDGWLRGFDSESKARLARNGSNLVRGGMPMAVVE
jgi:hypothetical protein